VITVRTKVPKNPKISLMYAYTFCFLNFSLNLIVGIYHCSCDETPKVEFVVFGDNIDILATLGVQKCYFEVISSALSYT